MCSSLDVFEMGTHRTRILSDRLTSTCMSKPEDLLENQIILKVLPSRDYILKRHAIVYIAGGGYSCPPTRGIAVFIQPTCHDNADCPTLLPCTSLRGNNVDDLTVCKFRCQLKESWDYILVQLVTCDTAADVTVDWWLCEIWFSNV